jgi:hypothetical protein
MEVNTMGWKRMRGSVLVAASVSGALLAGCGTAVEFVQTHPPPRMWEARPPESVEILAAGPPRRPYVEVGMLEARPLTYQVDSPQFILAKLRERAAQLGCDAIVVTGRIDGAVVDKGYHAVCLMYPTTGSEAPAADR